MRWRPTRATNWAFPPPRAPGRCKPRWHRPSVSLSARCCRCWWRCGCRLPDTSGAGGIGADFPRHSRRHRCENRRCADLAGRGAYPDLERHGDGGFLRRRHAVWRRGRLAPRLHQSAAPQVQYLSFVSRRRSRHGDGNAKSVRDIYAKITDSTVGCAASAVATNGRPRAYHWFNPRATTLAAGLPHVGLTAADVAAAEQRTARFAPYLAAAFPETQPTGGSSNPSWWRSPPCSRRWIGAMGCNLAGSCC